MYIVGANPYGGLWTKAQYQSGKGATPGTRASVVGSNGQTKEFVAIKLGAATWINGVALLIDGVTSGGVGSAVATASGLPTNTMQNRIGILVFASTTATQTMAGTAFGWAQIYGECLAWVSASVTLPAQQLACGASGQLIAAVAQVSASNQVVGLSAVATNTASTTAALMLTVLLQYPRFSGLPDANLS